MNNTIKELATNKVFNNIYVADTLVKAHDYIKAELTLQKAARWARLAGMRYAYDYLKECALEVNIWEGMSNYQADEVRSKIGVAA